MIVDLEAYEAFLKVLDQEPESNPKLKELLKEEIEVERFLAPKDQYVIVYKDRQFTEIISEPLSKEEAQEKFKRVDTSYKTFSAAYLCRLDIIEEK